MNDDLRELLESLKSHRVEFLVVGAHALAFHGRPRMTDDLDIWVNPSKENSERLQAALDKFGAPIGAEGAQAFANKERQIVRVGVPPSMVDILNFAGSRPFEEVWRRKVSGDVDGIAVHFPCKEDFTEMKRASGRAQDIADIERMSRE